MATFRFAHAVDFLATGAAPPQVAAGGNRHGPAKALLYARASGRRSPRPEGGRPVLSQRGRYALKAMINLARSDASRQVSAIALEESIPRKFLEAIMSELRKAGLVESARGKTGGYRLARPADLITFGEIIRITDGPLALVPWVSPHFYKPSGGCN